MFIFTLSIYIIPFKITIEKWEYEKNMQDYREDEEKLKEQELESLQDGYLNYYDTVTIILTDYENVSANQAILTNVVYLLS